MAAKSKAIAKKSSAAKPKPKPKPPKPYPKVVASNPTPEKAKPARIVPAPRVSVTHVYCLHWRKARGGETYHQYFVTEEEALASKASPQFPYPGAVETIVVPDEKRSFVHFLNSHTRRL